MTDKTTTEQLVEIEGQAEDTPATEYTPPEGWRVLKHGEVLQGGDEWVNWEGTEARPDILHGDGTTASGGRYIRRIKQEPQAEPQPKPEPQPVPQQYTPPDGWRVLAVGERLRFGDMTVRKDGYCYLTERVGFFVGANQRYIRPIESEPQPQPEPQPIQVREGRWRTRNGLVKDVTAMPTDHEDFAAAYPWWDGVSTWRNDGRWLAGGSTMDLLEYLGPIEEQPEPQPQPQPHTAAIEELRSEVSHVQRLLGESNRKVAQLEDLVGSLRTINEAQEKAFTAANKTNDDLQHRLNVVAAEWAEQAETSRRLQIELDAAQQVPQAIADRFEEGWNQGTARAVETVLEWLEPIRVVDHLNLSNEILQHLPQIIRHLTGLAQD